MFNNCIKSRLFLGAAVSALMLGSAVNTAVAEDYTTGTVNGVVQDEAGTTLSNATIILTSNKGITRTVTSGSNGKFRIPALPIGRYAISISKEGFNVLSDQTVTVSIGASGKLTFTMDSKNADIEEIYVVGTRRAGYDFNTTTTGLTVNVDELFERTPLARNAESIALLAPGSAEGDSTFGGGDNVNLVSIGGSSVGENVYYINGMNITNFRNLTGGSTVPFEFYDNIEIKTGGYQAEFGRSIGGVFNGVTKSGSNEFHATANVFWEGNSFRSKSPRTFRNFGGSNRTVFRELYTQERLESNFTLSGPLIKDRLFFFALYNPRNIKNTTVHQSRRNDFVKNDPFWGLKFDLNLFEGHHLEATFFSDDQSRTIDTFEFNGTDNLGNVIAPGDVTLEGGTGAFVGKQDQKRGGINKIFKYTGVINEWLTISGLYGINRFNRTDDVGDSKNFPFITDENGNTVGQAVASNFVTARDEREAIRIDADIYFDLAGEHHVRVGWDKENLLSEDLNERSGGRAITYNIATGTENNFELFTGDVSTLTGQLYADISQFSSGGLYKTIQSAWYIQDSWQVLENLTLNLGIRNETFDNKDANDTTFIKTSNQWAPRLGFTWDPLNDGIHRIYGNWGRYHLPVAANTNIRLAAPEFFVTDSWLVDGKNSDQTPNIDFADEARHLSHRVTGNGNLPDPRTLVDINIKPMYQDEFILGYDHDFQNGWTAGVRGIYRKLGSLIEDIAIDAAVIQWAADNGYGDVSNIWSGFHQYILTNPGNDIQVGTTDLPGTNGELIIMDLNGKDVGQPKGRRSYKAIEFTFSREWDGVWSLDGSYTLSWSKGNYEGNIKSDNGQDDAGITTDFDQPGLTEGAFGFLPNDRRHKFKIWGAYQATEEITFTGKFTMNSPRKFGCWGPHPRNADGSFNFASAYGSNSYYCDLNGDGVSELTPRGSQGESDWIKRLDLGVTITPPLNSSIPGNMSFRIDVFNVFNTAGVTDRVERGELHSGAPKVDYLKAAGYQRPRTIRFSAGYKF